MARRDRGDSGQRAPAPSARPGERSEEGRGLLSRIPFLSSLLPPPRRRDGKSATLPDWVVIGALALLLLGEEDSDILPFLLLLLLWE